MKPTEIISICALLISFITFWLTYIRENKKRFQEKIYDLKYDAYKIILKEIWAYHQNVFSLLQEMQDFRGTKEKWLKKIQVESPGYYEKAYETKNLISEYVLLLPNQVIEKLDEISTLAISHVTSHYHFETSITIDSYDRLFEMYIELVDLIRKDLGINKINKSLNKRLARDLYPIGFRDSLN